MTTTSDNPTINDGALDELRRLRGALETLAGTQQGWSELISRQKDEIAAARRGEVAAALAPIARGLIAKLAALDALAGRLAAVENEATSSVAAIASGLRDELERMGVEFFEAMPGAEFDPQVHELVDGVETSEQPAHTVHATLRVGARLATGTVLRRAEVTIAIPLPVA